MKRPPEYSASRGNNYAYWICGCETVAGPLVTDDDIMSLCMYHKGYWAAEKEEISGREYFERVTRPVEMTEEAEAVLRELLQDPAIRWSVAEAEWVSDDDEVEDENTKLFIALTVFLVALLVGLGAWLIVSVA